jgi:hypothetical protein
MDIYGSCWFKLPVSSQFRMNTFHLRAVCTTSSHKCIFQWGDKVGPPASLPKLRCGLGPSKYENLFFYYKRF